MEPGEHQERERRQERERLVGEALEPGHPTILPGLKLVDQALR